MMEKTPPGETPENRFEGAFKAAPGVIDATAFFGRSKLVFGLAGAATFGVFLFTCLTNWGLFERELALYGYGYAWGPETRWALSYKECSGGHLYEGCYPGITAEAYLREIRWPRAWASGEFIEHALLLATFVGPLLVYLLLRRPAPVRFNANIDAVYTWRRGWLFGLIGSGLYIGRGTGFSYRIDTRFDRMELSARGGPALVRLARADDPGKTREFPIGPYRGGLRGQAQRLATALTGLFRAPDPVEFSAHLPRSYTPPWWQRIPCGARKLPADIDTRAEAWARKQDWWEGRQRATH